MRARVSRVIMALVWPFIFVAARTALWFEGDGRADAVQCLIGLAVFAVAGELGYRWVAGAGAALSFPVVVQATWRRP